MRYFYKTTGNVSIESSLFTQNNVSEIHLFAKIKEPKSFGNQAHDLIEALEWYFCENNIPYDSVVFTRYFVSDYANQDVVLNVITSRAIDTFMPCAVSIVQQPPLNGNKIAVWAYIINDNNRKPFDSKTILANDIKIVRGGYEHIWSTQLVSYNGTTDPGSQTENIFALFSDRLEQNGLSINNNCIRTWLYVRDIDLNYRYVVEARKKFFAKHDMTEKTHFIASTGIEGRHASPNVIVMMDAYSVGGISREQVRFLKALDYLSPTHEYGVTFERGTSIDFGDRRHIYISGTASINERGEVIYKGNISKQIDRTITNISALLRVANASMHDVAQMIVYVRDASDTGDVNQYLAENYKDIPKVVVQAPVCRPEWLVEVECMAIKGAENPAYRHF